MAEQVNSVSQLAKRLNVSTRTARRIIEDGALKAHRIGRQWRVFEEDLQDYLARQATDNPARLAFEIVPNDSTRSKPPITPDRLEATLILRVLGWTVAPDRFLTGNRGWVSRNRFRPTERIQDAFKLLMAASPTQYDLGGAKGKPSWVKVRIGTIAAESSALSLPLAICMAIAKALGIEVGACE